MRSLFLWLHRSISYLRSEPGQALVEYALILALVVVVLIVVLMLMGNQVKNLYCNVSGSLGT